MRNQSKIKSHCVFLGHFSRGYKTGEDHPNIGRYGFGHAIHLGTAMNSDLSILIFNQRFDNLKTYLHNNEVLRSQLMTSKYLRTLQLSSHLRWTAN